MNTSKLMGIFRLIIILSIIELLAGCGGGGGGGDGGGDIGQEAVYDATGTWDYTMTLKENNGGIVGAPTIETGILTITQSGNTATIVGDNGDGEPSTDQVTVSGASYTCTTQEVDKNGAQFTRTISVTLTSETSLSGTFSMEWISSKHSLIYQVTANKRSKPAEMSISSSAFNDGGTIPIQYACTSMGGSNMSPPLSWSNVPKGTKSIIIVIFDNDADDYIHWLVYGIAPTVTSIPAGIPLGEDVSGSIIAGGAKQYQNDSGTFGYFGLCPLSDRPHKYYFGIIALNVYVSTKAEFEATTKSNHLAIGGFIGYF